MGLDIYFYSKDKAKDCFEEKTKVGYFRKFNALFSWIHRHVEAIENCEYILVSKDHFTQLQSTLNELNTANCSIHFPTQFGFFFGSTEYDEWYWQDISELKIFVDKILSEFDFDQEEIYFWAWW